MERRNILNEIGSETINMFRDSFRRIIDEEVFNERIRCINNVVDAMLDVGVEEEKIEDRLVYYWDMRPSDARNFIKKEKILKERGSERRYLRGGWYE